jgi:hypothetical protein
VLCSLTAGSFVIVCGRGEDTVHAVCASLPLTFSGQRHFAFPFDFSHCLHDSGWHSLEKSFASLEAEGVGNVFAFIHSSGISQDRLIPRISHAHAAELMAVNVVRCSHVA